jgi:hypothetical protein
VSRRDTFDLGGFAMRAFLAACLAIVIIGAGSYFALSTLQQPTGVVYTTDGARISTQWSWRAVFRQATTSGSAVKTGKVTPEAPGELADDCNMRTSWQWIFVDFGSPEGEPAACSVSQ